MPRLDLRRIYDRVHQAGEAGAERVVDLAEAIEKPKKIGDALESIAKLEKAIPDPLLKLGETHAWADQIHHALTSIGPGVAAAKLAMPWAGFGVAVLVFVIKARADKERREREAQMRGQVANLAEGEKADRERTAEWARTTLGIEGLDEAGVGAMLAEIGRVEAEMTRARLDEISEEHAEAAREYFKELNKFLSERLSDMPETLVALRGDFSELLREAQGIRDTLDVVAREVTAGNVTLKMRAREENAPRARLVYYQRTTSLRGRESEMARLREFCDDPAAFRFWIVSGAGGVGKTRLAHELCLELETQGWDVGFLDKTNVTNWSRWEPQRPTLIVVDYFLARAQPWDEILHDLSGRTSGERLRILLVERTADADTWSRHLAESSLRDRFHGRYGWQNGELEVECLRIGGLKGDDLAGLFREVAGEDSRLDVEDAVARYAQIDPDGRPLIAILAAEAFAARATRGESSPEWSLDTFMEDVIRRLFRVWRESKVDREHGHLLLLATLLGGLDVSPAALRDLRASLGEIVPATLNDDMAGGLAATSGDWDPADPSIPALLPDVLGEAFVVWTLRGEWGAAFGNRAQSVEDAQAVLAEAVRRDEGLGTDIQTPLGDFSRRLAQDFPEGLREMRSLRSLDLSGTKVRHLAPLAGLSDLKTLSLMGMPVMDLVPLADLSGLTTLNLAYTLVTDLAPLVGLAELTSLDLSYTEVTDLASLTDLLGLTELVLVNTLVTDLAPLAGFASLTTLDIRGTRVTDLAPLAGLVSLRRLDLYGVRVTDLAPLAELTALTGLMLIGTGVADEEKARLRAALPNLQIGE